MSVKAQNDLVDAKKLISELIECLGEMGVAHLDIVKRAQRFLICDKQQFRSFVCNEGHTWYYYGRTFWCVGVYNGKNALWAANTDNGIPETEMLDGIRKVCAVDVEDAEQHQLDFVNDKFNTNFILNGRRSIVEG